jgi:hypothetical protein
MKDMGPRVVWTALLLGSSVSALSAQVSTAAGGRTEAPASRLEKGNDREVSVGDSMVSGAFIRPYRNLWKLNYRKPTGESMDAATWSDEVEEITLGSRHLLKRTQIAKYVNGGGSTLINVFDAKTFEPVSRDFRRKNGMFNHVDFDRGSIRFERAEAPGTDIKRGTVRLEKPVFDFYGGLYGLLIAGFPLKPGYSATLPSLDESTDDVRPATFKVLRREMVEAGPGQKVKAWVVECEDDGMMTFWLTKEAPYVIRLVYVNRQGLVSTYSMM